jgi:hypothetical protein
MGRAVFTLLLAALIFIPYALGEGFSSFTDDGRLKITLYYPAEVKSGTCFTLVFQTTFLGSVTVDRLRLTVTYQKRTAYVFRRRSLGTRLLVQRSTQTTPVKPSSSRSPTDGTSP